MAKNCAHYCRTHRVIHYAVQLIAHKVLPSFAVSHLIRRILPDLADNYSVLFFLLDLAPKLLYKEVRQLVNYVQTPARSPGTQPALYYSVMPVEDIVPVFLILLLHLRQSRHSPPRFILFRIVKEAVPAIIRGIFRLISAYAVIRSFFIEVHTVAAGVVKYAVKDYAYTHFLRSAAQFLEIFLCTEHRVYLFIAAGIIAVIGISTEYGI